MKHLILLFALILPLQGCVEIRQSIIDDITNPVHRGLYARCINKYQGEELDRCLAKRRKKITPAQAKMYECHAIPGIGDGVGDELRKCLKEAKE